MKPLTYKYTPKQIKEKIEKLKGERSLWESHWQELAEFLMPNRSDITVMRTPGDKRNIDLFDNTGINSLELLAGALHGMLTNPNARWFELTTGFDELDNQEDIAEWLQDTSIRMHNAMNNSNFQTEIHELYLDLCCFGTAGMSVDEDDVHIMRFFSHHIRTLYVEENAKGVIDHVYRVFQWKAKKIVDEYGLENVSKKVAEAYEKGKEDVFEIAQCVYPKHRNGDKEAKFKFDFISQHIILDEEHEMQVKGYRTYPFVVPRWTKSAGETYGRSPGMNALPEVKTINAMTETVLRGAQKVVDPPLMAPDDGFVLPIITRPGGINYYRSGSQDRIEPFANEGKIDFGFQAMQEKQKRIRESFYVDQLQLQQGPQMTATEVLQRTEERMRLLGPMLGRQQSELLRPLIDRVYDIMERRGLFKQAPKALQGRKVDVQYSSMIAKSQRIAEGQNIMRTLELLNPFIQLDPSVSDNLNGDGAFQVISKIFGLPSQIKRKEAEREDIRNARAEAQQKQLEMMQQQHEAQTGNQAAQAMATMKQAQ